VHYASVVDEAFTSDTSLKILFAECIAILIHHKNCVTIVGVVRLHPSCLYLFCFHDIQNFQIFIHSLINPLNLSFKSFINKMHEFVLLDKPNLPIKAELQQKKSKQITIFMLSHTSLVTNSNFVKSFQSVQNSKSNSYE